MFKSSFLCFSIIFILMNVINPSHIYSRGIREDKIERNWDRIEYSDNFKYYNVLFNRQGEKIGLEETTKPIYGQEIVIIYKTNGLNDGRSVQFIVSDYYMENAIYKNIPIINGEIKFEGKLFTDRQTIERLVNRNSVQFFCQIILPDFSIIRSELVNANLSLHIRCEVDDEDEWDDFTFILESMDGEYKRARNSLKDGISISKNLVMLVYTDLTPQKTYRLIGSYPKEDIIYYEHINILDWLEYYNDE